MTTLATITLLDLSGVKDSHIQERIQQKLIPLEDGRHVGDFDVIESLCDPSFIWLQKYRGRLKQRRKGQHDDKETWITPLYFSLYQLPAGATVEAYTFTDAIKLLKQRGLIA